MLRGWSITWALVLALSVAGCPDDDVTGGGGDVDAEADAEGDVPDGTSDDGGGGDDIHADSGPGTDTGSSASIELVALTAVGVRGLGVDQFALTQFDEPAAYVESAGYQMDLQARALGLPKATPVTLTIDGVDKGTASLDANVTNFPEVTLTPGVHQIKVRASLGGQLIEDVNTVTVGVGPCDVTVSPGPAACLLTDVDPVTAGLQVTFTVANPNKRCTLAYLQINGPSGTAQTAPVALDGDGVATITASLTTDDVPVNTAPVEVTAVVTWPGVDELTSAKVSTYKIDTQAPAPTITTPFKPILTAADDEGDPATPGISITVKGDVAGLSAEELDSLTLTVNGELRGTTSPSTNGKFQFKNVQFDASGDYTLRVVGVDTCGLTGSTEQGVTVDLGAVPPAPAVDLVAVTAQGVKGAGAATIPLVAADEPAAWAAAAGFQMDFEALTTNVPAGTTVTANVGGAVLQAQTDGAGAARFEGVNLTKGDTTISVGLTTGGQTAQVTKVVSLDIAACDVLVEPAGGCLTDDASPAPGLQATILVKNPDGLCDTATLTVQTDTGSTELTATLTAGQASFLVTIAAAGVDDVTLTATAKVESGGDPSLTAQTNAISFLGDALPPAITITEPASATVSTTADADGDPSNGLQLDLAGTVAGNHALDGLAPLAVSVDGVAQGSAAQTGGLWTAQITVAGSGTYEVAVSTADTCGLAASATLNLTVVDVPAPAVDLVAATANGPVGEGVDSIALDATDEPVTYQSTPGFQMDFSILTTNVPEGVVVTLSVGGATFEAAVDENGVALVGGVVLSKGAQVVSVTVSVGGQTAMVEKTITLDVPACDIVLEPSVASCLTDDASANPGFQAIFTVSNPDGQCDVAALVVTDTDGAKVTLGAALVDGQATFVATLAAGGADGETALVAAAVDSTTDPELAAQTNEVAFPVDTTAPVIAIIEPVGDLTTAADLDGDPSNGVQVTVSGTVSSATAVTLTVDGAPQGAATVDGGAFTGAVTLPGLGEHVITATATDGCGLTGASDVTLTLLPVLVPTIEVIASTANGPQGEGEGTITLGASDEPAAWLATQGYQMDFVILTEDVAEGTPITLLVGGAEVQAPAGPGGVTVFAGINLTKGTQAVGASVTVGGQSATSAKIVILDIPACDVTIEPATPACLTEDASGDAGFQAAFTVRNPDGQCDVAGLVVTRTDGTTATLTAPLVGGQAAFVATLALGAADGETAKVAASVDSTLDGGLYAQTGEVAFAVDATPPEVAITTPASNTASTTDDLDGIAANGVQLTIGGTSTGATTVELFLGGASQGAQTPSVSGAWSYEVTFTGAGTFALAVQASDGCGLESSAQRSLTIAAPPVEVAVLSPLGASTLFAKGDGDPGTALVYESTFTASVSLPTEGGVLQIQCTSADAPGLYVTVGSVTLTQTDIDSAVASAFDVPVGIDVGSIGTANTLCRATYELGDLWQSDPVLIIVALPAPSLVIAAPVAGWATSSLAVPASLFAQHLDGVTPVVVLADSDGTPVGDPITPDPIDGGALAFEVSLTQGGAPLPDGAYTLFVDATDAFGNLASEQAGAVTEVTFTLDTAAPSVTITAPKPLLQPQIVAEDADEDEAKPGYQTTVTVTVGASEPMETIEVCLTVGAAAPACQTPTAGSSEVSFSGVTLVPGANELSVSAADPLGNVGTAEQTTTLELDAPVVVITSPADGVFVTVEAIDVVVTVADGDGTPIPGADVELLIGGVSSGVAGTEDPAGTWTFAAAPLAAGPNELQVTATAAGVSGASASITVNRKTTLPSIGITLPTDLQTLNLASTVCQTGVTPCILDVQALVENVADGVETTLTVDCGAPDTFVSVVASGTSTWAGIVLPHQSTCSLKASVVDLAGQPAESAWITVSVDRVAPVLLSFPKPTGDVIQPTADEEVLVPGVQKKVQVNVRGVEQGRVIQVRVYPEGTDPSTVAPTLFGAAQTAVSDTGTLTVEVGTLSITTNGFWVLQADVMDAAGNPAASLLRTIYFNVTAPVVSIVSPTNVEPVACTVNANCGPAGICNDGKCAVPWGMNATRSVLLQLTGIAFGTDNLRLCTNNPGNGGSPCATAGFTVAKIGNATSNSVSLDASALGDGLHRIIAEAETFPGDGDWASSLVTAGAGLKERTIFIDTVAPVVTQITSTSDTLPPAFVLNQAEQVSPSTFAFAVTATDNGLPAKGTLEVYANAGFKVNLPITAGTASGNVNFTADGVKKMQAVVRDTVGNTSLPIANAAAYSVNYTVKVAPLTLTFLAPTKSPLLAGDSRAVSLSSNQTSGTVAILDGGVEVASKAIGADGTVLFDHATYGILSDGAHELTAVLTDTANNTAQAATEPAVITVDTEPPTVALAAPVTGALTDADDAAPTTGGFQVAVEFATGEASSWKILLQSGCTAAFTGCGAAVTVASGAISNPGGSEPVKVITLPITAGDTWHKVTVEVSDAVGNKATATADVQVTLAACVVSFTNLPLDGTYNGDDCAAPGCTSIDVNLGVQFLGPCNGVDTLTLYKDGVPVGQATDLATQEATFPLTLSDGEVFTIWAELTSGGGLVAETGNFDVVVDLIDPEVAFTAATVLGFQTPATGASIQWGLAADQTPGSTSTLEVHMRVTVTGGASGQIVALTATGPGGTTALAAGETPVAVTGTPFVHDFKFVSIPDQGVYTVVVTVADGAGNQASSSFQATVDISPPEEVIIEPIDALLDVVPRLPAVTLKWQPPSSNTGVPGGPASSYEIRYSSEPIATDADWADACPVAALPFVAPTPAPGDPDGAALDTYVVRGPDPRSINTNAACKFAVQPDAKGWYFAIRATDAVGNQSPVTGTGAAFTDAASLSYAKITHTVAAPMGNEVRLEDKVWAIGDINDDGYDDLAVGGQDMSGFCIVYGHDNGGDPLADVALAATSGTNYQCIFDATPTALGFPIARGGDMNGDGLPDLIAGAGIKLGANLYPEEVRVYLSVTGGGQIDPVPVLTVKGTTNNAIFGLKNIASAGNFNGDVHSTTGLPIEDLIIPSGIGNKVFIVPGSEAFVPGSSTTINVTSATDRAAWDVVTVTVSGAQGNSYFGWCVEGAGNILTDVGSSQYDDVLIAMAKDPAQVILLKGRPVSGDTVIPLSNSNSGAQAGDATAVRLLPELGVGTNSFGADLGVRRDLDGKGTPDIVINHQYASATVGRIYTFFGEKLTGKEGLSVSVQPSGPATVDGAQAGLNGVMYQKQQHYAWPLGDFDGSLFGEQSTVDLAYSVYSFSSYGKVTIRLNHASGAPGMVEGLLPFEDVVIRDPYTEPPSDKFGITWAPIGDFNGDGLPDLLVGTNGMGWAVLVY